ncbi:hypothetical protein TWF970_011088 [Orbilia oligospora]|uniref:Uncharacterized protein n=1 Tax=Orbilia oligospora TaxID=2813651 RepID=A0A7C8VJU5_ORBOL|nr:hypothetical protein TWF970_011088 [Orbilia oligospora]
MENECMNSGLRPFALGLRPLSRCQTPQLCAGPFLTWAPAPPFVGSGPSKWSKFAEKGFGTVVVHGDLTSVKLFEVLFDISVSCTKTPTRKYPLETHVEMGSEFAVEEKCMKWTKFADKGVEPANAHGTFKCLIVVAEKHQLAGASRKDFLKRKKIAGESISEEKVEEDEDNAGEE